MGSHASFWHLRATQIDITTTTTTSILTIAIWIFEAPIPAT